MNDYQYWERIPAMDTPEKDAWMHRMSGAVRYSEKSCTPFWALPSD